MFVNKMLCNVLTGSQQRMLAIFWVYRRYSMFVNKMLCNVLTGSQQRMLAIFWVYRRYSQSNLLGKSWMA